jgi:hypothetical protein
MMIFIVRYLAYRKQVIQIISAMRAYELDLARYFWINYLRGVSCLKQYSQVVLRSETDISAKKSQIIPARSYVACPLFQAAGKAEITTYTF